MLNRIIFFLICQFLLSPTINAEIYKWVDENGQVHYSDTPKNKKSKKFEYKPKVIGQENFTDKSDKTETTQQPGSPVVKDKAPQGLTKKSPSAPAKEDGEKRKRYCQEAKEDLQATRQANLLYEYDDKGKRYFLNKQQRENAIEKKQNIVKKWCG